MLQVRCSTCRKKIDSDGRPLADQGWTVTARRQVCPDCTFKAEEEEATPIEDESEEHGGYSGARPTARLKKAIT